MRKLVAAVAAALVAAVVVSVALAADPPVTVKASGAHYVITGSAPDVAPGHVMSIDVFHKGIAVSSGVTYTPPTSANHYAFRVVAKKSVLPKGNYTLELVVVGKGSKTDFIKFPFVIAK